MTPRTPPRRPARQRGLSGGQLAVLVAAAIAIPLVTWAATRAVGRDEQARPGAAAGDPGLSHVHGLGINPADGSLIVATHYGSFRIPPDGDDAVRIGDSFQDTMGFTVAGADHFLGSGHPDIKGIQGGQPSRLGLIESTDGGVTWTVLSLEGEVDFHGLALSHGQVFGWDSGTGRLMVSADRTHWETRSTVDLFGFSVDPEDVDHIVGTGPTGLIESNDGGRTWAGTGDPRVVATSWDAEAGLWGVDAAGTVWRRTESGWSRAGALPGEPQALLATPDGLFAAAHDDEGATGIYRSTDEGRTWVLRYRSTQQ